MTRCGAGQAVLGVGMIVLACLAQPVRAQTTTPNTAPTPAVDVEPAIQQEFVLNSATRVVSGFNFKRLLQQIRENAEQHAPAAAPLQAAQTATDTAPAVDTEKALIAKADAAFKKGDCAGTLQFADEATTLNARLFEAPYYAALALYCQGLLAESERRALLALSLTDEPSRAQVTRLVAQISAGITHATKLAEGDKALKEGLKARAARAYAAAWQALPKDSESGMKAAQLWLDLTDEVIEAASILRAISQNATDAAIAARATSTVSSLSVRLRALAESQADIGRKAMREGNLGEARRAFSVAKDASADNIAIRFELLRCLAQIGDMPALKSELMAALNQAHYGANTVATDKMLVRQLGSSEHAEFLNDLYGPIGAETIAKAYRKDTESRSEKLRSLEVMQRELSTFKNQYEEVKEYDRRDCRTDSFALMLTFGLATIGNSSCREKSYKAQDARNGIERLQKRIETVKAQLQE